MIYHHQFLKHGLVFPQTNITMKPQVLHRGTSSNFFCQTNRYEKCSITVSVIESWNKIQKQLKSILLKDLSPNKIKTVVTNFYYKSC